MNTFQVILQIGGALIPFITQATSAIAAEAAAVQALQAAGFAADTDALNAAILDDERREAISRAIAAGTPEAEPTADAPPAEG